MPASTVVPVLTYPDVREAVAWLGDAFGFIERVKIGEDHRAQLSLGDGDLIVADVGSERRPPRPGEVTHAVVLRVDDARTLCEHVRSHGARIVTEPTDWDYGERQFTAETLADVAPEEWGGEAINPR